jgi:hypothetical protein
MAQVATDGRVAVAVAEYVGTWVNSVEVIPDPNVAGTFAVQAKMNGVIPVQFLIVDVPLQKVTVLDLYEVEFDSWPPTAVR